MSNWYARRSEIKRAADINGATEDRKIDRTIEAMSRRIDSETRRYFIPRTETRLYRWPQPRPSRSSTLYLDQGLISLTTLQTKAQDSSPTTIAATDYFLEPNNQGPPFDTIEIDYSSTAAFEAGDTSQRSISIDGSWGYQADTISAGTVISGLASSATATSAVISDGSLLDVGDTILVDSEQLFAKAKQGAALASILINGALTADRAEVAITVDGGTHGINDGEVIRVNAELMYVVSSTTTVVTVIRAYDGSVLAAHNNDTAVHIFRTITIERGVNGTTAATHANDTAWSVYEPPYDIRALCMAETIAALMQESAAWARTIGVGEQTRELTGKGLQDLRDRVIGEYRRIRMASI